MIKNVITSLRMYQHAQLFFRDVSHVPVGNDSPCCKGCVVCWHFFITQTSPCVKTPLTPTFLCTEDASSCRSSHIHARRLSVYFCALFLTIAILLQNPPYLFILIGLLAFHHPSVVDFLFAPTPWNLSHCFSLSLSSVLLLFTIVCYFLYLNKKLNLPDFYLVLFAGSTLWILEPVCLVSSSRLSGSLKLFHMNK